MSTLIHFPEMVTGTQFLSLQDRLENHESLDEIIEKWTRQRDKHQAIEELQTAGVPAAAVLDRGEAFTGIQLQAWVGVLVELTHPDGVKYPYSRMPVRFSKTPAEVRTPGPLLGKHNEYLLGPLLGIPSQEKARLESSGVTATLSTDLHQGT